MGKFEKAKTNQKQLKKYSLLGIGAVIVVLLAVMPMVAAQRESLEKENASILTATVETRDIPIQLMGGGQLSGAGSLNIRIPETVKLTRYLVKNGDSVQKGDAIATVDRVSVMSAIMELQETLDYLSQQISSAASGTESNSVRAQAGGTVKAVYGQRGEAVQDVMLREGCLAVLSLDGLMAVKIERRTTLDIGDRVCVFLPDGTETDGRVAGNREGILTVTVEDNKYEIGTKVTVETDEGKRIGSGELYVYSQWNATAYSGKISDIQVRKNEKVAAGRLMFLMENSGNTARFQQLVDQRRKHEELMQELFALYETQTLVAPCDGILSGVDEEGAYLLARQEQGLAAQLLSWFGKEKKTAFTAFAVQVAERTDDGMLLKIAPSAVRVEDVAQVSAVAVNPSEMTQTWNYIGETLVYSQSERGLLEPAGEAEVGDLLLMVGSEAEIGWFVIPGDPADPQENDEQSVGFLTLLTAAEDLTEVEQSETEETTMPDGESLTEAEVPRFRRPGRWDRPDDSDEETEGEETGGEDDETAGDETGNGDAETEDDADQPGGDTAEEVSYYLGYIAQVTAISDGTLTVKQQNPAYAVTSLEALANVVVEAGALTTEATYTGASITGDLAEVGDYLRLTVSLDGTTLQEIAEYTMSSGEESKDKDTAGEGTSQKGEGRPSSGGTAGGSGGQIKSFELYTEEKVTVASVTSQEHMTVSVTIDELDITKLSVGHPALVCVDALGGEQFEAVITNISNIGVNEGGNSKFTVELTLARGGEMLPGMYASVSITLETRKSVPCLPVAALEKSGTDTIVYTGCDEKTGSPENPVAVTLGCSDGEYAEILDGLTPGQTCYYRYYDTYLETETPRGSGFSFRQIMGRR